MFTVKLFKVEKGDHYIQSVSEAVSYTINRRDDSISLTRPRDPNQALRRDVEMVTIQVHKEGGWQKAVVENAAGQTIDTLTPK